MKKLEVTYCNGCSACVNKCPKHCIEMVKDQEGFLYPAIMESQCIDCHLCEKVCPVLNKRETVLPVRVYVARNSDAIVVKRSSSGGIFSLFALNILRKGGVVFGARFNDKFEVIHDYIADEKELGLLQGSKYIQSDLNKTFTEVKSLLKIGRKVLFSGTPCQIAGLKSFLGIKYENLLTVDFICHGVPSPGVWKSYLTETLKELNIESLDKVTRISFRDKIIGWKRFGFSISYHSTENKALSFTETLDKNHFLKGFISNLYLRPSCHHCLFKNWSSGSDITIADAWGVENIYPELNDDKGYNLVIISTKKGETFFNGLPKSGFSLYPANEEFIKKYNPAAYIPAKAHKKRVKFFRMYKKGLPFNFIIDNCLPPPTYWDKLLWSINKRIKLLRNEK